MSKENVLRFFALLKQDKDLRARYEGVMSRYDGQILGEADKDRITTEEILPIAGAVGFDFTLEELKELSDSSPKEVKLSDEELEDVTGGIVVTWYDKRIAMQCYVISDKEQLINYFETWENDCPHHKYTHGPAVHNCCTCFYFVVSAQ